MIAALAAAALICLDPGHGTVPAVGAQTEPIGPGSTVMKIKDGGGAPGEADVALRIALRTRTLLLARGYRVAMTRTAPGYTGGNIARAQFCNARHAALMLRIHADGSTDTRDPRRLDPLPRPPPRLDRRHLRAQPARGEARAAGARARDGRPDLGIIQRSDLTGFNWANVPVVLVETGFMSNPAERARLQSAAYEDKVARGLVAGVAAFTPR